VVTLVIGGARSGKSEFAEQFASTRRNNRLFYVATLRPAGDRENLERIRRHQTIRAARSFETVELYTPDDLDHWCNELNSEGNAVVLLDCLGVMLSQGKYVESDGGQWVELENETVECAVMSALGKLARKTEDLIIVAPDIFKAKAPDPSTDRYMRLLGSVLQSIVEILDSSVVEVVAGIPVIRRDCTGALNSFAERIGS
jgi:adenosylcobinamide kinase/adenosylcobinamide-phosphate guanylyltransferase